jgi:regulator of sirC expression with transglutaminase-like and TPR domain
VTPGDASDTFGADGESQRRKAGMRQHEARSLFERLVSVPEDEIDVVHAALAIAAEEDSTLDVDGWLHRIDGLVFRVLADLPDTATEAERLASLHALFFDELGFAGVGTDFDDPGSSFLNLVVERRKGLPIALAVLFVRLGRKLGLSCAGVGFPGHFLAKVMTSAGEVFVDPFNRQRSLTAKDLSSRLAKGSHGQKLERWMLAAATPNQTLARMLRNLKHLYSKKRDHARAFSAVDRALLVQPQSAEDIRDRGLYCLELGGSDAARRDLERYLSLAPGAPDVGMIKSRLRTVKERRVFLN